jgi:predicted DNA-binding transcriptional regulator AlpA
LVFRIDCRYPLGYRSRVGTARRAATVRPVLTLAEVKKALGGMSKTTLWRLIETGQFPAPLQVSPQGKVWLEDDVKWYVHGLEIVGRLEKKLFQPVSTPDQPVSSSPVGLESRKSRG